MVKLKDVSFDNVFKVAVILLLIVFAFLYYQSVGMQRYHFYSPDNDVMVFDSKTGQVYTLVDLGWVKLPPINEATQIPLETKKP